MVFSPLARPRVWADEENVADYERLRNREKSHAYMRKRNGDALHRSGRKFSV